jgi:type II secretory pathway pseudopilin PulG
MIVAVKRETNMQERHILDQGFTILELLVVFVCIFISVAVAFFITQG